MIFNDDQELFRESVREFCTRELEPRLKEILETNELPKDLYLKAGEIGITGVNIPEEYGGVGMGQVESCIVMEELCRVCPGFALSIEQSLDNNVMLLQSEALTEKYMARVAAGELRIGSGATPPQGQANTSEHEVFARRVEGGYICNGTRLYATNCDAELVFAIGLDEDGNTISAFFESDWEGVEQGPLDRKLGQAGNHGGTMVFNDVFVPDENVVPTSIGTSTTYYMVYGLCPAEALGCAKGIFEKTVEFCKNRTNDFKPLTSMSAVRYNLAELQSKIYMAESMVYDVATYMDAYQANPDPRLFDEWTKRSEAVKMRVGELLMDVAYECVKLNGGLGYHDPLIWHYLGDQLNYCIMDQTTEIHLGALAELMDLG